MGPREARNALEKQWYFIRYHSSRPRMSGEIKDIFQGSEEDLKSRSKSISDIPYPGDTIIRKVPKI